MDVTVVIPTRNGGARLRLLFDRLREQVTNLSWEVIVADSASTDGSAEAARHHGFTVIDIDPRTFNHGLTRDQAIGASRGSAAILLVQDAVPVDAHWLDELARPLLEDEGAAGSFSRQLPIPGGNPILAHRLEHWVAGRDEPRRRALGDRKWDELDPFERLDHVAFDNVSSCIRRSCWAQRPFGQRDFGEDLAWSTWAIRAGHAIRFHPRSVVEHSHDRSAWYEARRIYCDHRNLHDLLELTTVPDFAAVRRARRTSLDHYRGILETAALSGEERGRRWRWAKHYAWGEALAQWLAPKVNRSGARGLLGWLDRRIRRGI